MTQRIIQVFSTLFLLVLASWLTSCGRTKPPRNLATMSDKELLDKASDVAFDKLAKAKDRLDRLDEPYKTVAIIYSAQGVIDNGGLAYFFENDWSNHPPYSMFADAYERIGRIKAAQVIRDAAASFGVSDPEKNMTARRAYIEANSKKEVFDGMVWDDCVCGDDEVWTGLAAWIRAQPDFEL